MPKKKSTTLKNNKLTQNFTRIILEYIARERYKPVTADELTTKLAIAPIHLELFKQILSDLLKDGKLSFHRDCYAMPKHHENLLSGTISVHHKGFGFVKVGSGPDVFIPKHLVADAVDGDTVEIEVASIVSAKGPEGAVVAVLKRSRTHVACTIISQTGPLTGYSPFLGKDRLILVKKDPSLKEGDRIICKVINWQGENGIIEAEMTSKIGHISDPSIDIDAAIEEFELPTKFSIECVEEAQEYGAKISAKDAKGRLDLTQDECVTIDPDTAKDFDDAITLTQDDRGHYHLGVHIADVAHYVRPGTHLDTEAFSRCNSTYFPGRCVPMLPEELSNELCSLKPKVKRLTMSVLAEFSKSGDLIDYKIERTVIKSAKRFTYKEAYDVIQKKKKSVHAPLLDRMVELCLLLKKKRSERGSIDFAMSEDVIMVDEKGVPLGLETIEYDITHQMIEEFMLKANELTALYLAKQGKTLIYRIHEEPTVESFQDFYTFARSLGFNLPNTPSHLDIQRLFIEAKSSPLLSQLSISFVRSMRLAKYSPENIGHYGLALEHYCHFTSPIRRYSDLIIQRLLVDELPKDTDLDAVALNCSEQERLSFKAESSVKLLKKMRLAKTHFDEDPGQLYDAVVTKVKPFAVFFEVEKFDLESSVHVSKLGNDYFEYNPKKLTFTGKHSNKVYAAGQKIQVRLDRINFVLQETEWSINTPARGSSTDRKSSEKAPESRSEKSSKKGARKKGDNPKRRRRR